METKGLRNETRMGHERNQDVGLHIVRDSAAGLEIREGENEKWIFVKRGRGAFKTGPLVRYFTQLWLETLKLWLSLPPLWIIYHTFDLRLQQKWWWRSVTRSDCWVTEWDNVSGQPSVNQLCLKPKMLCFNTRLCLTCFIHMYPARQHPNLLISKKSHPESLTALFLSHPLLLCEEAQWCRTDAAACMMRKDLEFVGHTFQLWLWNETELGPQISEASL